VLNSRANKKESPVVIVDDLLMLPMRGVLWVLREIHNAAEQELANEADSITAELSNLYMRLETARISEAEFAAEEKILLERLDSLRESNGSLEGRESASGGRGRRGRARAA
jgi:hypothetical protein